MDRLSTLMKTTDDPWIRYHAAGFAYIDYGLADARIVLEDLAGQRGLFSPLAQVALGQGGSKGWFLK
jgi:hypothetical protein